MDSKQFLNPNSLGATNSKLTASATGNPKNKVALKPGHSLLDWIKLTHKEKDLAGTGGKITPVTLEELRKHNKSGDLWMALRGKVYNLSAYSDFHPGGEEELLKGAGKDGTQLFNDVHRWVNYDSMLKKCLVGPFKSGGMLPNQLDAEGTLLPVKHGTSPPGFNHKWTQTADSVTVTLYCRNKKLTRDSLVVDVDEYEWELRVIIRLYGWTFLLHIKLFAAVKPEVDVVLSPDGSKFEITLYKKENEDWASLGMGMPGNDTVSEADEVRPYSRVGTLVYKEDVAHDTRLFCINIGNGCRLGIPVGQHVHLSIKDKGRFYTPVDPALSADGLGLSPNLLYFLVKIYSNGKFTPILDSLEEGAEVEISDPMGSFEYEWLEQWEELMLLAAGTGVTPMIRIINCVLTKLKSKDVRLLLFNRTEKDIPWREALQNLSGQVEKFRVSLILSEAEGDWNGPTGRVRASLVKSHMTPQKKVGVLVCGSTGFNSTALKAVQECGVTEEQVHIFSG